MHRIIKSETQIIVEGEDFSGITVFVPKGVKYVNCKFYRCKVLYKKEDFEDDWIANFCIFNESDFIHY